MMEYRFDPFLTVEEINRLARDGWRVIHVKSCGIVDNVDCDTGEGDEIFECLLEKQAEANELHQPEPISITRSYPPPPHPVDSGGLVRKTT